MTPARMKSCSQKTMDGTVRVLGPDQSEKLLKGGVLVSLPGQVRKEGECVGAVQLGHVFCKLHITIELVRNSVRSSSLVAVDDLQGRVVVDIDQFLLRERLLVLPGTD